MELTVLDDLRDALRALRVAKERARDAEKRAQRVLGDLRVRAKSGEYKAVQL